MQRIVYALNNVKLSSCLFNYYINILPFNLREKILRYHKWKDAQASLFGKLLLKSLLKRYQTNFTLSDLKIDSWGRPYIDNSFDFNISHSGSYVVCSYSDEGRMGIDLEVIQKVDLDNFSLTIFNQYELDLIKSADNVNDIFFEFWTIKEAAIKADGRGLGIPLKQVKIKSDNVIIEDASWYVKKIDFQEGYILHVAAAAPIKEPLQVTEIEFHSQVPAITLLS